MAVTLQQIAELAGVSRGTVDRALNNRGRIKPEVAEKIRKIAKDLGYQPSRAGRALSIAKKNLKIGVIIQRVDTPFMQSVLEGIKAAQREAESLGVSLEIHEIKKVNASEVIDIMRKMHEDQVNGIALSPTNDGYLAHTINKFVDEYDIPVLTFNSDLEGCDRFCFVGQNAVKSGQTAAGLMGEILDGKGEVLLISTYEENTTLEKRAAGFIEELQIAYPNIKILGMRYAYDDDWVAQKIIEESLESCPGMNGIYITAGTGIKGVCDALKKARQSRAVNIKVIANDLLEKNIAYLKDGSIKFLIGDDPYAQGYKSVMILFQKLLDGKNPDTPLQYTDITIKNRYNI